MPMATTLCLGTSWCKGIGFTAPAEPITYAFMKCQKNWLLHTHTLLGKLT